MKHFNLFLIFVISITYLKSQVSQQDSLALVDFYNALDGPNWNNNNNWLSDQSVSNWNGVGVSGDRVNRIDLRRNNLKGVIPSSFSALDKLTMVDVSENNITDIPDLSAMIDMIQLNLGNNMLSEFPVGIANMTRLNNLFLIDNQITGQIPDDLSSLTLLKRVSFGNNPLSGPVPDMKGWTLLEQLHLSNSDLSGDLSDVLPASGSMNNLNAENCLLTGSIPSSAFLKGSDVIIIFTNNDIEDITRLDELMIRRLWTRDNRLDFANLLPFLENVEDFRYDSQKPILAPETRNVIPGGNITLVSDIDGAGTSYQWYKNDELIEGATAVEWVINNADESDVGVYYCSGTHPEFPGMTLTQTPTMLTVDHSTSINEVNPEVNLYPNPFTERVMISSTEIIDQAVVYNMQGQQVLTVNPGSDRFQLDLSGLPDSQYLLSILSNSVSKSQIIIKQ
ncbi:MAG: T9SS type A sorting domain-containing protein [Saprospiraceae bacterium]|nr:T9SS type A sorting domain-containing protein [Saprospiraceae bacterium]